MAIGYDDMIAADAYHYFHGCVAFRFTGDTVDPYGLDMSYDEENHDDPAHDLMYRIYRVGEDVLKRSERIGGDRLFIGTEFITHRFNLEYVPINNGKQLVRISVEPHDSRRCKGIKESNYRQLPILEPGKRNLSDVYRTPPDPEWADTLRGVANVLAVGTPPVMRPRIPLPEAQAKARALVSDYMTDTEQNVCVPDFRVALIKRPADPTWAYVLRCGGHIGYLNHESVGRTRFYPIAAVGGDPAARKAVEKGVVTLSVNLLTPNVTVPIQPDTLPWEAK